MSTSGPWIEPAAAVEWPHPAWVFDIEREQLVWANARGCEFWAAEDLRTLGNRDFSSDMSDATRARLAACMDAFERGEEVEELWTLYPRGVPRVVRLRCSATPLPDGRHGMLALVLPGESDPGALRAVEALRHSNAIITLWRPGVDKPLYRSPKALQTYGSAESTAELGDRYVDAEPARAIRESIESGRAWQGAARARTRDGVRWHQVDVRPVVDPVSGDAAVLLHEEDVHRVKEIEAQLRESHATLEQRVRERTAELELRERIASVGTLAAGVAHELNNPLSFVMGNLELVIEELRGAPITTSQAGEPVALLEECLAGARRMAGIITELASFARPITDDSSSVVALSGLVRSSTRLASPELRHRARLVEELGSELDQVGVDERLGQVFVNLVVNAAQAIPLGHVSQHQVSVSAWLEGDTAVVRVEDDGCGIDPALATRVFEPFFTTKAIGSNSGLGLFVCQRIVHEVGGQIELRPRDEGGTTVRVQVPVVRLQVATPAPNIRPRVERPLRILLVDDEADVRRTLARQLRGHRVVDVGSGREALDLLAQGASFDGVLCDLGMPEITGMDVYHAIEATHPGLSQRTLWMTGGAFTPEMVAFVEAHRDQVLTKPFERSELLRAVEDRFGSADDDAE